MLYIPIVRGQHMAGCCSIEQLNEILRTAYEYPEASPDEISGITGYSPAVIRSALARYPKPQMEMFDETVDIRRSDLHDHLRAR